MAMWADNVKFVKDIIDSKYQKIDTAITEVSIIRNNSFSRVIFIPCFISCLDRARM